MRLIFNFKFHPNRCISFILRAYFYLIRFEKQTLILSSIYIPLNMNYNTYELYTKSIEEMFYKYHRSNIIFIADFNLSAIVWSQNKTKKKTHRYRRNKY